MRLILAAVLWAVVLLCAGYAFAIEAKKDYPLILTGEEIVYIAKLLQAQPYVEVVTVIDKIRTQTTQVEPEPVMTEPPHKE